MSVQSHYIMIGANIGYEKENEDDWEKHRYLGNFCVANHSREDDFWQVG